MMKHPALVRVMAVVLVIMCVIMLVVGALGIGEAGEARAADIDEYDKLIARIATYEELSEKLGESESYKVQSERLDAEREEHDKDASEFRTELAERTATQGGYKQGADALWEAKAEADSALRGYQEAQAQLNAQQAAFNASKPEIEAQIGMLSGLADSAPQAPKPVAECSPPEGDEPVQAEGESDEDFQARHDAYKTALENYNAYQNYLTALNNYNAAAPVYLAQAGQAFAMLGMQCPSTPEEAAGALSQLAQSYSSQLEAGKAALDAASAQMTAAGTKLMEAQAKVQGGLETIWYKLGELEDEQADIESDRDDLLAEAERLDRAMEALEQLKKDEQKLSSTRAHLKNYDGVAEKLDAGMALDAAAKEYADEFYNEYNRLYKGRIVICIAEILGGLVGLICLPAAFEKLKSRFILIAPAVLSFICAAAAEALGLYLGLGQSYEVMPVMIFAAVYLACALPQNKPAPASAPAAEAANEEEEANEAKAEAEAEETLSSAEEVSPTADEADA